MSFYGYTELQFQYLKENDSSYPILNLKDEPSGSFTILKYEERQKYSISDFLIRGFHTINFSLAIDFTLSNQHPSKESSLHRLSERKNPYQEAIEDITERIAIFDKDQLFPTYAIGVIPEDKKEVDFCYPITGFEKSAQLKGI